MERKESETERLAKKGRRGIQHLQEVFGKSWSWGRPAARKERIQVHGKACHLGLKWQRAAWSEAERLAVDSRRP